MEKHFRRKSIKKKQKQLMEKLRPKCIRQNYIYNPLKLLQEQEKVLPRAQKHPTLFVFMTKEVKNDKRRMGQLLIF